MTRKTRFVVGGAAALALAWFAFASTFGRSSRPALATAPVERGDITEVVGATGVLQAVTTVQVGSQVSGTIASLHADFNSRVRKGEVVARLDPALFEARVEQAKANLVSARANADRTHATAEDARQKYERARELSTQDLVPVTDLESAKATFDAAVAQDRATEAAISQSEAAVNQAQLDLSHTVITAPIDGVVLGRSVDVGQTVAASLQAPTLFVIANDLTRMQVKASIDEADIGRVHEGQEVRFRVDAHPDEEFRGTVEQVRLQPITTNNVVTYDTLISVANPDQKLMPGMTATVSVVIQEKKNVLRVPAAALRYRPENFTERGRFVFVKDPAGQPKATAVKVGLSDGAHTEILEGVSEGLQVVTGGADGGAAQARGPRPSPSPGASTNPFSPQRPQPRTRS
jgi:HlyD family secretion protein